VDIMLLLTQAMLRWREIDIKIFPSLRDPSHNTLRPGLHFRAWCCLWSHVHLQMVHEAANIAKSRCMAPAACRAPSSTGALGAAEDTSESTEASIPCGRPFGHALTLYM
jgi:hypothetical protein